METASLSDAKSSSFENISQLTTLAAVRVQTQVGQKTSDPTF